MLQINLPNLVPYQTMILAAMLIADAHGVITVLWHWLQADVRRTFEENLCSLSPQCVPSPLRGVSQGKHSVQSRPAVLAVGGSRSPGYDDPLYFHGQPRE